MGRLWLDKVTLTTQIIYHRSQFIVSVFLLNQQVATLDPIMPSQCVSHSLHLWVLYKDVDSKT